MWIKKIDEYKNEYKFSKWNITFYDTDLNSTQLIWLEFDKLEKWDYEEIIFLDKSIIDLWSNLILVEIDNKDIENKKKWFVDNFKKDWYFAKELENKRQIPKYKWYFEYNKKTYLMVDWLNKLTDEINEKLWVYKWLIVDIDKYYLVSEDSKKVIEEVWWIVDNILN